MSETSASEQANQPWSYYLGKTLKYAFFALLWFVVAGVIGDGFIETGKVSRDVGMLFLYGAFIIASYCGIRAALYALVDHRLAITASTRHCRHSECQCGSKT